MTTKTTIVTSTPDAVSLEQFNQLKQSLEATQKGEKWWQQPVSINTETSIGKSMQKEKQALMNAAIKEMISQNPQFAGIEGDLDCWTVGQVLQCFETIVGKFAAALTAERGRSTPKGAKFAAALTGGSRGNDAGDNELNAFNRLDWKLKYNEVARILYPSADADTDDLRTALTDEVAPRLAYYMERHQGVGGFVGENYVRGIEGAIQSTIRTTAVELAHEQAQANRGIYTGIKARNKKLVSPAQIVSLMAENPDAIALEIENDRRLYARKKGLSGELLDLFVQRHMTIEGKWNLPEDYLNNKLSAFDSFNRDLTIVTGVEDQVSRLRTYLFCEKQSYEGGSKFSELRKLVELDLMDEDDGAYETIINLITVQEIEELEELLSDFEAYKNIKFRTNIRKIAKVACNTVNNAYLHSAGIDGPLPEKVERMLLQKVYNGFIRKMTDTEEAISDFENGTNYSGKNNGAKGDTNMATYHSGKLELLKLAEAQVGQRLLTIETMEQLQGNAGILDISGTVQDEFEDDGNIDY